MTLIVKSLADLPAPKSATASRIKSGANGVRTSPSGASVRTALDPTAPDPAVAALPPAARLLELPHGAIRSTKDNPRTIFEAEKIHELALAIAARGLIVPLAVCAGPVPDSYILVDGERRWRALGRLIEQGVWPEDRPIPCAIGAAEGDGAMIDSLVANLQRENLTPLEEAEAFVKLRDFDPERYGTGKLAALIGKDRRHVQLRLALVEKLAPEVQMALAGNKIELAHARELTSLPRAVQGAKLEDLVAALEHDPVTAEDLRAELDDDRMDPALAIFDVAPHGARIVTLEAKSGKTDERWFIGKADFLKLQKAAAQARARELRKTWAWADVSTGYFASYQYESKTSKDRAKAGVLLSIDSHTGELTERTGLVKHKRAESSNANSDTERERRAAQETAGAQFQTELCRAIAGGDPVEALRLLAFLLLAPDHVAVLDLENFGYRNELFADGRPGAPWRETFGGLVGQDGWWKSGTKAAAIWAQLDGLAKSDLPKLLAALTANYVVVRTWGEPDPALVSIAEAFDVAVPEPLRPKGAKAKPAKAKPAKTAKGKS